MKAASAGVLLGVLSLVSARTQTQEGNPSHSHVATRIDRMETGRERDHMTGDWGGARDQLVDRGIHFSAGYTGEMISNVSGGKKEGSVYQGLVELGLDLDPAKFSAWRGGLMHVSSLYPHGASSSGQLVGDLSTVSNLDAYDSWVLFELWLEQAFWEDRFSIRLGQLAADEEFVTSDLSGLFINSSLGWPSFIAWNTPSPAYPIAAPGVRLAYEISDALRIHAGIYDGQPDPGDSQGRPVNVHGTHWNLDSQEGAFTIWEMAWANERDESGERRKYPGTYKIGFWHHTGGFEPLFDSQPGLAPNRPPTGEVPEQSGDVWGYYFVVDQWLWSEAEEGQGLGMFLRAAAGPSRRLVIDYYVDAGLVYQGLLPERDEDKLGWGISYAHLSRQAREQARIAGAPQPSFEVALELTYEMNVNTWWSLQPDLQYIIHPGAQAARDNAFVLGLRSSFVF